MSRPTIHGRMTVFSASNALDCIGRALHEIKHEDGLTWEDVGAVLGVSDDQAAKYASGTASMSAVTFLRGWREWNGRFIGYAQRLAEESRPGTIDGYSTLGHLIAVTGALHEAMKDGQLTPQEIRACRKMLEELRDEINSLLAQIEVRAA